MIVLGRMDGKIKAGHSTTGRGESKEEERVIEKSGREPDEITADSLS